MTSIWGINPGHLEEKLGICVFPGKLRQLPVSAKIQLQIQDWREGHKSDPLPWAVFFWRKKIWLVVSTHLKNISQIGNLPQVGVKIKHIWNHHLEIAWPNCPLYRTVSEPVESISTWLNRYNKTGCTKSKKNCLFRPFKNWYCKNINSGVNMASSCINNPHRHQASTLSSIGGVQSPHHSIQNLKVLQDRPLLVVHRVTSPINGQTEG